MPVFISYRHMDRPQAMAINTPPDAGQHQDLPRCARPGIADHRRHHRRDHPQHHRMHTLARGGVGENRSVVVGAVRNRRSDDQQSPDLLVQDRARRKLPVYLDKWPKLSTASDLNFFIDAYREEVDRASAR